MTCYIVYVHYIDEKGRKRNYPVSKSYFFTRSEDRIIAWLEHHLQMGLIRHPKLARLLYGAEDFEVRVNRTQSWGERAGLHPVGWFIVNFERGYLHIKKKYSGVKAIPSLPDGLQPFFKKPENRFFDRSNQGPTWSSFESRVMKRHIKFFDETPEEKERRAFRSMRFRRSF